VAFYFPSFQQWPTSSADRHFSRDTGSPFGFGQPRCTATEAIDALVEADGLAECRPAPLGRRAKLISLTPAGEAVSNTVRLLQRQSCQELREVFSDEESVQFATLLVRFNCKLRCASAPMP
jgi:hypothetical protein